MVVSLAPSALAVLDSDANCLPERSNAFTCRAGYAERGDKFATQKKTPYANGIRARNRMNPEENFHVRSAGHQGQRHGSEAACGKTRRLE